ncbi:hypothetical protein C8R43DRAFT_942629 [Mycena crocata]|nr:hypothetical protein C8R43DRAFT_942629 [Mycena crocata]
MAIAKYANLVWIQCGEICTRSLSNGRCRLQLSEDAIKKEMPTANIRQLILDLSSISPSRKAAEVANNYREPLHVLIHNAAAPIAPFKLTVDKLEIQLAAAQGSERDIDPEKPSQDFLEGDEDDAPELSGPDVADLSFVDLPGESAVSSFESLTDGGLRLIAGDIVMVETLGLLRNLTARVPANWLGTILSVVQKSLIAEFTAQWEPPAQVLCRLVHTTLSQHVKNSRLSALVVLRPRRSGTASDDYMKQHADAARALISKLILLEVDGPLTVSEQYLADCKYKFLSHYQKQRNSELAEVIAASSIAAILNNLAAIGLQWYIDR